MKRTLVLKRSIAGLLLASFALFAMTMSAGAQVTPAEVNETLAPGATITVDKTVQTPTIPPVLDFCLLVDNSGSYFDDIATIKALAPGIFDDVRDEVADSQFCLATFVDFPISPYGVPGDYEYMLDQDLTGDKTTWVSAVNAMGTLNGNDPPESQLEALDRMASGADAPAWRSNSTRVIAITTDAPFHDPATTAGYPGPTFADVVTNLNAQGVKVIAIKAPGSTTQMDAIANATGGSVQSTGSSSDEIADAIITGLSNLDVTVTPVAVGCDPLVVTFDPTDVTVTSGEVAAFTETITVPEDAAGGSTIDCMVEFQLDGGSVIGTQTIPSPWLTPRRLRWRASRRSTQPARTNPRLRARAGKVRTKTGSTSFWPATTWTVP
ncbi:MAG: hypothetical protein WD645_05645 [Dehalococcoidia bacterium]